MNKAKATAATAAIVAIAAVLIAGCAGSDQTVRGDQSPQHSAWTANCTNPAGVQIAVTRPGEDINLQFPDGYHTDGAQATVTSDYWQFAVNSGAMRSDTEYAFALQEKQPNAAPGAVKITVTGFQSSPNAPDTVAFTLWLEDDTGKIGDCR